MLADNEVLVVLRLHTAPDKVKLLFVWTRYLLHFSLDYLLKHSIDEIIYLLPHEKIVPESARGSDFWSG